MALLILANCRTRPQRGLRRRARTKLIILGIRLVVPATASLILLALAPPGSPQGNHDCSWAPFLRISAPVGTFSPSNWSSGAHQSNQSSRHGYFNWLTVASAFTQSLLLSVSPECVTSSRAHVIALRSVAKAHNSLNPAIVGLLREGGMSVVQVFISVALPARHEADCGVVSVSLSQRKVHYLNPNRMTVLSNC